MFIKVLGAGPVRYLDELMLGFQCRMRLREDFRQVKLGL